MTVITRTDIGTDYQSIVQSYLQRTAEALERIAPPGRLADWLVFPSDDGIEPMPQGDAVIDFKNLRVTSNKGTQLIVGNPDIVDKLYSVNIIADSLVDIKVDPGLSVFVTYPCYTISGVGKKIEKILLRSHVPYLLTVVAGTSIFPLDVRAVCLPQYRFSNVTLVKKSVAGSDDLFDDTTAINFIPRTVKKTLTAAQAGFSSHIHTHSQTNKFYIVRNVGPGVAQFQVRGVMLINAVSEFRALSTADIGWVEDTDVTRSTGGAGIPVTVASGSAAIIETNIPWVEVQLRGRVSAAGEARSQAQCIIEFMSLSPSIR